MTIGKEKRRKEEKYYSVIREVRRRSQDAK